MVHVINLIVIVLFIFSFGALSEPKKAYRGNILAIVAMAITLIVSLLKLPGQYLLPVILMILSGAAVGMIVSHKTKMSHLPQLIALFNGLGGLSAGIIGLAEMTGMYQNKFLILGIISVGFITFSGSMAAFLKLGYPRFVIDYHLWRRASVVFFVMSILAGVYAFSGDLVYVLGFAGLLCLCGFFFILPIGGADMSIIISVLNSFSGWSTVLVGFSLENTLMIMVGTLVGSSGMVLSYMMTKVMNRKFRRVIFPLFNAEDGSVAEERHYNRGTARDAAFLMQNAKKVIIVPGYGMAVANAQSAVAQLAEILRTKYNVDVKFAIHPVAGRMPGHMNVLLAEADVDTGIVFELKDINQEFRTADVAYVIGANDITNPRAKTDKDSPIYLMPILEVSEARKVLIVKRSLGVGYAGTENPLFYADNTIMLLGDAQEITKQIVADLA